MFQPTGSHPQAGCPRGPIPTEPGRAWPRSQEAGQGSLNGCLVDSTTKGRGSPARDVMVLCMRTDCSFRGIAHEPETAPSTREDRPEARVQSVVEPEVTRAAGRDRSLLILGPRWKAGTGRHRMKKAHPPVRGRFGGRGRHRSTPLRGVDPTVFSLRFDGRVER